MEDKDLQVIYNYLTNNIDDKKIKELIYFLQDYVINGSLQDYELTTDDYNEVSRNIVTSHSLMSHDSIDNLINELQNIKEMF